MTERGFFFSPTTFFSRMCEKRFFKKRERKNVTIRDTERKGNKKNEVKERRKKKITSYKKKRRETERKKD